MTEKRRDNKGRILRTGESQRTDGRYLYKYVTILVRHSAFMHGNLYLRIRHQPKA